LIGGKKLMTTDELEERRVYLELNRNESRIIFERMRAMLTFHGLLFAAVGVSAGQHLWGLAILLAIVGAAMCAPWAYSVRLSYKGTAGVGNEYNKRKPNDAPPLDAYAIPTHRQWEFRLLPEVFLPWELLFIWVVIALILYFYPPLSGH
jgi:hypothetical protein